MSTLQDTHWVVEWFKAPVLKASLAIFGYSLKLQRLTCFAV